MAKTLIFVAGFAVAGQLIAYLLTILLARHFTVEGFEAYAVASAVFILLVSVASGGLDKFSIRLIPVLLARRDFLGARGFLEFGVRRTLTLSIVVLAAAAAIVWWFGNPGQVQPLSSSPSSRFRRQVSRTFGVEYGSAGAGREVLALAILRVAVPIVVLTLVGMAIAMSLLNSAAFAIGIWGLAWVASVVLLFASIRPMLPGAAWRHSRGGMSPSWTSEAAPFLDLSDGSGGVGTV